MSDIEILVRETLTRHLAEVPVPEPTKARPVAVGARRRQVLNALGAVVVGAMIALSATSGIGALLRIEAPRPAGPKPMPTLSPAVEVIEELPALIPDAVGTITGPFAEARGWIALRSGPHIVAVDPADATHTVVVGRSRGWDPVGWSADGARLLLASKPEGWAQGTYSPPEPRLHVMTADGSIVTLPVPPREHPSNRLAVWGAFSPDGGAIAYGCCGSSRGPFVIDLSSGTHHALGDPCPIREIQGRTVELCGEPAEEAAAWSPAGSTIAWFDFAEGTIQGHGHENFLSFVNLDGTGLREGVARLPGDFGGSNLVWSPDGSQLAFWISPEEDASGQIFVIDADGSGLRQITSDGDNRWPTWSPDGSRVAFVHNGTLHTMTPDGSGVQEMEGVRPDGAVAWNPVG